ncbi:MAG: class I SAM-dependent methyltransferase [Clostridiales bacterium]|nr:class I SAM-dependent methyltransferase [Clostridiales bacterium]
MTRRLQIICSYIPKGKTFADVGCDHGYCAKYALDNGLCEVAYITDISKASLQKAETLLKGEIAAGKCIPVCCDGLSGLDCVPDCVLIAGMGGEEIIHILSDLPLPEKFVLQPMKNADKVRAFLIGRGAKISTDHTFYDGKYYDLIVGDGAGGDTYSDWEIAFGRDNLKNPSPDFANRMEHDREECIKLLQNTSLSRESREEILDRKKRTEAILNAITPDI